MKDTNNNFLSLQELQKKYGFKIQPLTYCGLISALKSLWKTSNRRDLTNNCKEYESFSSPLIKFQKPSKLVYDRLVAMKASAPTLSQHKWLEDCNLRQNDINWSAAYQLASKITKSTKLREFQFRLLHRRLPTNDFLTKIRIKEDPQCSFCKEECEKLIHLFWNCPITALFWEKMVARLKTFQSIQDDFSLDRTLALGLRPVSSKFHHQVNFCFLIARHFIWLCKIKDSAPSFQECLKYLKSLHRVHAHGTVNHSLPNEWAFLNGIS